MSQFLHGKDGTYDFFNVHNTDTGFSLFVFFARNTIVEWSLIIGKESYLSTSHNPGTDEGGSLLLEHELNKYGVNSVSLFIHDHPYTNPPRYNGLYGPSGFYQGDLHSGSPSNDRVNAMFFDYWFPGNTVSFEVYDVRTSQIFNFTGGQTPAPSWYPNFVGPPPLYQYPSYPMVLLPWLLKR